MGKVEAIEKQIEGLSEEELARFRAWFAEYDADAWDAQIEADIKAGKLDTLFADAIADDDAGKSRDI